MSRAPSSSLCATAAGPITNPCRSESGGQFLSGTRLVLLPGVEPEVLHMRNTKRQNNGASQNQKKEQSEHLPEWKRVFQGLRDQAEEAYPDGRMRVILPDDYDDPDAPDPQSTEEGTDEQAPKV